MAEKGHMRVDLKQMMDALGVGYTLSAYETCPWSVYDGEKGLTVSAEVRMNNTGDEVEAELQIMHDVPEAGKPPVEQVCWIFAKPVANGLWSVTALRIKGKDSANAVYDWEQKCCNFFRACVADLKMDNVPDIEELLEKEFNQNERFSDGRQGTTSKAPKIKPNALLGMKGGRGF